MKKEYKSPFERQKEAEIKRLDKKIEKSKETMQEEALALKEKQLRLREQQLLVIKSEIRSVRPHKGMHLVDEHKKQKLDI